MDLEKEKLNSIWASLPELSSESNDKENTKEGAVTRKPRVHWAYVEGACGNANCQNKGCKSLQSSENEDNNSMASFSNMTK